MLDEKLYLGSGAIIESFYCCNIYQSRLKDDKHLDMVDIPLFTIDDDILACDMESQANADAQRQLLENLSLLSVDDILGSVLETTHQVGRISVSTCHIKKWLSIVRPSSWESSRRFPLSWVPIHSLQGISFRIPTPDYSQGKDESTNSNVQQSLPLFPSYYSKSSICWNGTVSSLGQV